MTIILNGQNLQIPRPLSIQDLLAEHGYGDMLVAVAVNGTFVSRGNHATHMIKNGDTIEIVAPMQGG
jgi:sulfur carrier protein